MRQILFRGKRKDNGQWVEGYYCQFSDGASAIFNGDIWDEVSPNTVGQFTGLTDKNGNKIWEDDICRAIDDNGLHLNGTVSFMSGSFYIKGDVMSHYRLTDYDIEIIGNIHDNPKML